MRLVSDRGPQPLLAAARWCVDCRRKPLEDETVHGGSPYPKRNHGREGFSWRSDAMTHPTTRPMDNGDPPITNRLLPHARAILIR